MWPFKKPEPKPEKFQCTYILTKEQSLRYWEYEDVIDRGGFHGTGLCRGKGPKELARERWYWLWDLMHTAHPKVHDMHGNLHVNTDRVNVQLYFTEL